MTALYLLADELADTAITGRDERQTGETGNGTGGMENTDGNGFRWESGGTRVEGTEKTEISCSMGDTTGKRCREAREAGAGYPERSAGASAGIGKAGQSFWSDADWIYCRDGKWRPVEPGLVPLAHGIPGRMGALQAYGNAIVPQVAAEVIRAYMEVTS